MNPTYNELAPVISLDGEWEFSLAGQSGVFVAPGTWEAQGFPRRVDGPASFRKTFSVPVDWQGQRIELQFDAVSYYAEVSLNGQPLGTHTGLWSAFAFDVTEHLHFGAENELTLTVYEPGERFPMRESLAGFLPDVCIPFGGIWQPARLVAFESAAVNDVRIATNPLTGAVSVSGNLSHTPQGTLEVEIFDAGTPIGIWRTPAADGSFEAQLVVDRAKLWSPDAPNLCLLEIRLVDHNGTVSARVRRKFGFRSLSRDSERLLFNGEPAFLRGALNWGWYPHILCPAPDEAAIRDEFRRVREFGYNMVKLCLYVPSPLYFDIADEEGMLLWLELPMWLPEVTPRLRQQAPIEYADILAQVHHHPSIVIYSLGCELGHGVDDALLEQLNNLLRGAVHNVLVCDNSGSGEAYGGLGFDFADFNDYHFYCDLHNFDPLVDHFRRDWRTPRPWIFGEFCDADDYRDLEEIAAEHGGELPWWLVEQNPVHLVSIIGYSTQKTRMSQLDLGFRHQDIQRISRQQSFALRKNILEKVRRRSFMGGYVVTGLRDTPLATSAMFDDLKRPKYDADQFREFNADSVLVLEQGRARVWKNGGDRPAPVDRFNRVSGERLDYRMILSQTGAALPDSSLHWALADLDGHTVEEGRSPVTATAPTGIPQEIAPISLTAPQVDTPQQFELTAELEGTGIHNRWPIWVYPAITMWPTHLALFDPSGSLNGLDDLLDAAENITHLADFSALMGKTLITSAFTPDVQAFVQAGGRALVMQTSAGSLPGRACPFWRESVKLLYNHPVLKQFPHQGYADMQFYNLATDYALDMDALQAGLPQVSAVKPIFRRLDARLFTVHEYLVEAQIGAGTALLTTLRFAGGAGDQTAGLKANPAARFLLHELLSYLSTQ